MRRNDEQVEYEPESMCGGIEVHRSSNLSGLQPYPLATQTDELVQGIDGDGADEKPLEDRRLHQACTAMQNEKTVQRDVEVMGPPEGVEEIATSHRQREDIDRDDKQGQDVASHTCI